MNWNEHDRGKTGTDSKNFISFSIPPSAGKTNRNKQSVQNSNTNIMFCSHFQWVSCSVRPWDLCLRTILKCENLLKTDIFKDNSFYSFFFFKSTTLQRTSLFHRSFIALHIQLGIIIITLRVLYRYLETTSRESRVFFTLFYISPRPYFARRRARSEIS